MKMKLNKADSSQLFANTAHILTLIIVDVI